MESVQTLREHVDLSQDFERRSEFLAILDKAGRYLQESQDNERIKVASCINLEGIDGVGKTTLANKLARCGRISTRLVSVPSELKSYRAYFDKQDESVKRHFFHLWDIIISSELLTLTGTTIAILDRYWPTTIAYRLAHQTNSTVISEDIRWPPYLTKPSHIVYIYLDEEVRRQRIEQRETKIPISEEEKRIASDVEFRSRLDQIYRQVSGIYPIDGAQSADALVDEILKLVENSSVEIV